MFNTKHFYFPYFHFDVLYPYFHFDALFDNHEHDCTIKKTTKHLNSNNNFHTITDFEAMVMQ